MLVLSLIALLAIHFFTGHGLLSLLNVPLSGIRRIALSFVLGITIASLLPFILQLAYIPITLPSTAFLLILVLFACNINNLNKPYFGLRKVQFPAITLYEWPFLIVFFLLFLISAWRCFYFPVQARDMLSGPEAIAEFTVKEQTMINSVFSVNLQSTNNPFKSTYITSLQIIYKLFGFPFGQVWLTILSWSFIVFLYSLLRERVHKLIAAILLLFFLMIPELFGYTYMILYDYSNMMFLFLGAYFILMYFQSRNNGFYILSAFFLAAAVYTRLETIVLISLFLPFFFFFLWKKLQLSLFAAMKKTAILLLVISLVYVVCIVIYNGHYLPVQYKISDQVADLSQVHSFFKRFADMNRALIFGFDTFKYWGIFMYLFVTILLIDLIVNRAISREGQFWLLFVFIIYVGLPIIGYLLPLADLMNTTKRGLFKLFPFMVLYLSDTKLLKQFSDRITRWQYA